MSNILKNEFFETALIQRNDNKTRRALGRADISDTQ